MKRYIMAAAVLALIAAPAQAQMGGKRPRGEDKKSEQKKPEIDEKAYKAALERMAENLQASGIRSAESVI